jgi:CBS domain containing-hemolysin-like protein
VQQLFSLPASIAIMVMPISLVPVSIPVNDLLYRFIKNRTSIACVVDEFGSVVGLITMEDVLEQLFGEIDDEHDLDVLVEEQVGEGEFLFSGRLSIHELNMRYTWLKLPDRGFNTLSGLLIDELQRIPKAGHRFRLGGNTFIIEEVSDRKIDILRVFAG